MVCVLLLSSSHAMLFSTPGYEVLVIVPVTGDPDTQSSLQEDMLKGVNLAKDSLSSVCFPFDLSIKELRVDCSSEGTPLVQLVRELTTNDDRLTLAVLGYFCEKTFHDLELIGAGSPDHVGVVQVAVNQFLPVSETLSRPYYYHMLPSSLALAEALSQFTEWAGWSRVGVAFTELHNSYDYQISQHVIRVLKEKEYGLTVETFRVNDVHKMVLKQIHISGVKIVVVLLPPKEAALFICGAFNYGLKWPDYGWIVLNTTLELFKREVNCDHIALQGIISFQVSSDHEVINNTNGDCSEKPFFPHSNIYGKAIYDSILGIALSLNLSLPQIKALLSQENSSLISPYAKLKTQRVISHMTGQTLDTVSFHGALGKINFDKHGSVSKTNISFFQSIDGTRSKIGTYSSHSNISYYTKTASSLPSDKLSRIHSSLPLPLEVFLTTCMAICFLTSLANFVLYVYYRNTPEVKASSLRLSMLIHISCFLMMIGGQFFISVTGTVVDDSFRIECTIQNWLIYPWGDMILATLLFKLCRIYHIFNSHGRVNMKLCSDTTLMACIFSIVLGKVLILSLWSSLDVFINTDVEIYHSETKPPYIEVEQHCISHHYFLWLCTALGYTGLLGAVLGCVAFRARKIKHSDFKNTKKINATVSVCFTAVGIVVPMWWTFRASGNTNASTSLLALMYMILPMCCQMCLFWPKIIPPLMRSRHNYTHRKPIGSHSQVQKRNVKQINTSKVIS